MTSCATLHGALERERPAGDGRWLRPGCATDRPGRLHPHVVQSVLDTAPHDAEIIAIDDGSDPYVLRCLRRGLCDADHFVLRCNDLFEIRTYNRAIALSRGKIVALLQDDDLYDSEQ